MGFFDGLTREGFLCRFLKVDAVSSSLTRTGKRFPTTHKALPVIHTSLSFLSALDMHGNRLEGNMFNREGKYYYGSR